MDVDKSLIKRIEAVMHANDARKHDGMCRCDFSVGVVCEACYTHGVLAECKREVERLRAQLAAAKEAKP